MTDTLPTLHMMCGKIAAGKSTLAAELVRQNDAVLIVEDAWLSALYADELATGADYLRCTSKLRSIMKPHVLTLLQTGVSVVLDFSANTLEQRKWMRGLVDAAPGPHQLHVLLTPDEVCLARLRVRNASGDHPFVVTEAQFHQFSKHFVVPTAEEGFSLIVHDSVG